MLLEIHQCRGSREVVWIPTDPWPKLGRLKRRKHLPDEDTSTDVWYLDRYDHYLERPIAAIPIKYPDYYRYYRRTQREPGGTTAIASNPAEDFAYDSPSSESDDGVSGDRFQADLRPVEGERPYWWPSPPETLQITFTDESGKKWILRRRTAIPRWKFYLPYGEDAELYFLQKILLSQPFTKADHERKILSSNNVTKTYMEECIHRGLFRGYEEEEKTKFKQWGFPVTRILYSRIRQDTAGYGRIRQDTAGYGRIRQDTPGYAGDGRIRQDTAGYGRYGRIRQDTAGYGRIRQGPKYLLVCTAKTTILRSFSVRWYFILFLHAYCDFPG